jgi:hypothetical protein
MLCLNPPLLLPYRPVGSSSDEDALPVLGRYIRRGSQLEIGLGSVVHDYTLKRAWAYNEAFGGGGTPTATTAPGMFHHWLGAAYMMQPPPRVRMGACPMTWCCIQ